MFAVAATLEPPSVTTQEKKGEKKIKIPPGPTRQSLPLPLSVFASPWHASPPADPDTCRPSSTAVPRSPSARPYPSPRPCSSFPPLPSRARAEQSRPPPPPTPSPPSIPRLRSVSPRFLAQGAPSHSPPPIPTLIRPWASLCRAAAVLLRPPPPIAVAPPPRRRSSPASPPVRLASFPYTPCARAPSPSGLAPPRRRPPAPPRRARRAARAGSAVAAHTTRSGAPWPRSSAGQGRRRALTRPGVAR